MAKRPHVYDNIPYEGFDAMTINPLSTRNMSYAPQMASYVSMPSSMTYAPINSNGNSKGASIAAMFSNLRNRFGKDKALLGGKFDLSALKNLGSDIRATQLYQGGPTMGQLGTAGMGLYQGINAVKGFTENAQADTDYNNLIKDIKSSAYSNPMVSQYLTSDQRKLLRQARTGGIDVANWGGAAQGAMQGIPQALLSALIGGVVGGAPGAVVGGLGSLGNSAIQGYGNRTREQTDRLSGLYSALQNAEMSYNDEANRRIRNNHFNYMY